MLADAFLQRSSKALEHAVALASPEALKSALEAATGAGGVAALLSDLAPLDASVGVLDPFVEALARGARIKQELLQEAGGGLTSEQVAKALGMTRQGVDKRRTRGALLAVSTGSGDYLYPACQFDADGVIEGFSEVLRAFSLRNPWTQLSALLAASPALGGKSMLKALQAGEIEKVVAVAESLGEQGA